MVANKPGTALMCRACDKTSTETVSPGSVMQVLSRSFVLRVSHAAQLRMFRTHPSAACREAGVRHMAHDISVTQFFMTVCSYGKMHAQFMSRDPARGRCNRVMSIVAYARSLSSGACAETR